MIMIVQTDEDPKFEKRGVYCLPLSLTAGNPQASNGYSSLPNLWHFMIRKEKTRRHKKFE